MDANELIRIIFLDIDGVLQTRRTARAFDDCGVLSVLDPVGVKYLDTLCSLHSDLKIVISSTWREGRSIRDFKTIFGAAGAVSLKKALYWGTGNGVEAGKDFKTKCLSGIRGDEIEEWLSRHEDEVGYYAILDDDSDFHPYQLPHLVKTTYSEGISYENMVQLENLLFGKEALDDENAGFRSSDES